MSQSSVRPVVANAAHPSRASGRFPRATVAAVSLAALLLAACATTEPTPPPPPPPPQWTSPIPAASLVGRYGLAAYHRPEDAGRTEAQAKAQCSNPYIITAGPSGGVLMYLADDNKLTEVVSKVVPGNPTYIGPPEDPAGGDRDRQVLRFDGHVLVLKWVDPEIAKRYGTMVYVRCGN